MLLNSIFEFSSCNIHKCLQKVQTPMYFRCHLVAVLGFLRQGFAWALLAAVFATPCLAGARPKAVTTWTFPGKGTKSKTVKPKIAKPQPNINYPHRRMLATQNLQAQQAARRGVQQQLRQTQSSDQSTAR